jgi:hypothetical protein
MGFNAQLGAWGALDCTTQGPIASPIANITRRPVVRARADGDDAAGGTARHGDDRRGRDHGR